MCGITGKVSPGPIEPALLQRMCGAIVHRGPDSHGAYIADGVALGIQRLAVIDLATGDQPIFNEDGSVVVVLNGEIYNYKELRERLEFAGHRFTTQTDTEVIVHLYEDHGDECVSHLRGMFAFALWDVGRRRLLLARDRLGKKPLFYARRGPTFWFASEAKAILQDPEAPREVDLAAVDAFLTLGYVPQPWSAFAGIRKLPAAHTLVLDDGNVTTSRYWKLSYGEKLSTEATEDVHELIRSQLLEATRLRLRSDVPVGAFLSGGIDSSSVVAAMTRVATGSVKTFSIGFASAEFDETPYAREVARLLGTEHHEFQVEPDAVELLPLLAWHYGEPFADQSAIPTFYLSQMTRSHVTVALTGDGGDENFAGYPRYFGNELASRLAWCPPRAAQAAAVALDRIGTGSRMNSHRARLLRLARALAAPAADRYGTWLSITQQPLRDALYAPAMRAAADTAAVRAVTALPYLESDAVNPVERLLDVDIQTRLVDQLLVKVDIASMAHSLEVRSPLLDHIFVETMAKLPPSAKLQGRTSKRVFKDALRPWLPDHILDRPKRGFAVPIRDWLRRELRPLAADVLLDPVSLARGLFAEKPLRRLIDAHVSGAADNSSVIWALIQLELWFRTYIDRRPTGPINVA